ncbi:hypothetical protein GIB67_023967 [Kingdonia uniflora]|uniref:Uncharacterized protein n=1 Tax=Kingdonia uniflora TaxID=39325 RepID=A0A7J7LPC4_9MAGN|nr:hypothetical protein GIB67_023967 [Kingdonia uniflora]
MPARRDDADTCPEELSFQKLRDNIKVCLSSSLKPQSVADRGRSIYRERKSSNFERSSPVLYDLAKKNKVLPSEMRVKNLKPISKIDVSSSDDSSSSARTIDDSKVRGTVTVDMPVVVQSGVNERLEEKVEAGDFFKYPADVDVGKTFSKYKKDLARKWRHYVMNAGLSFRTLVRPDGRIEHYQVPSLDQWKRNMDIGDDVEISYYNGTGVEVIEEGFLCYLNQVVYGLSIPLNFFQKGVMNALECCPAQLNGRKSGYLYSDSARPKFFDFEFAWRPWYDHLVMVRGNCMQVPGELALKLLYKNFNEKPNPKGVADTSGLFDVVSWEGTNLNQVLGEVRFLPVLRVLRVSNLDDLEEKKALPLLEQTTLAQTTQAETEGVNLKAVEQEELDLAKRDPIRLDTQILSSISQLSVAWKSVVEVLKVAAADRTEYEVEIASLAEQLKERTALCEQLQKEKALWLEQLEHEKTLQKKQFETESAVLMEELKVEGKKSLDSVVTVRNSLVQAFYFWGLKREDVSLVIAGKYGEIIFSEEDPSSVAERPDEQTLAPPMVDDTTPKVAGANL